MGDYIDLKRMADLQSTVVEEQRPPQVNKSRGGLHSLMQSYQYSDKGGLIMHNQDDAYQRVEKRVEEKLGLYIHIAAYIIINLFLIGLNLSVSPEAYWFQWPLIGWGIGLLFHALTVFLLYGKAGIRERMIEKEMREEGLKS